MADPPEPQQYFAERPLVPVRSKSVDLALPDLSLTLLSDAGVFSGDRVDPGTKLLLLEAPTPPPGGDLLDLGCGYGPIAVTLARRVPAATVWAVDVNERALELTAKNAEAAGVGGRLRACRPDQVPDGVRFSAIWSNPPIRIGKQALHDVLTAWLDRLTPNGQAIFVVQKHLGSDSLGRWLQERGHPVRRLVSRGGYRLMEVQPCVP